MTDEGDAIVAEQSAELLTATPSATRPRFEQAYDLQAYDLQAYDLDGDKLTGTLGGGAIMFFTLADGRRGYLLEAEKGNLRGSVIGTGEEVSGAQLVGARFTRSATTASGRAVALELSIDQVISVKDATTVGSRMSLRYGDSYHGIPITWGPPVLTNANGGATHLFYLSIVDHVGGVEKKHPLCRETKSETMFGRWAIPVRGTWGADGKRRSGDGFEVTFGCLGGVIAKCYKWGYRPWQSAATKSAHQACTRMARADYCGIGSSGTRDGTYIDTWDVNVSSPLYTYAPRDGFAIEAYWGEDGAVCVSHARITYPSPERDSPASMPSRGRFGAGCDGETLAACRRGLSSSPPVRFGNASDPASWANTLVEDPASP